MKKESSKLKAKKKVEAEVKVEVKPEVEPEVLNIKKRYSRKFYMMMICGIAAVVGLGLFILYVMNTNILLGVTSVVLMAAGTLFFVHYYQKEESIVVQQIDGVQTDEVFNSMCIYEDKVEFANIYQPEGFPMQCMNDHNTYYVQIWDKDDKKLIPFVLPDQQYIDPIVFAQRVLGLPAHKRIFERKPKLLQRLKTVMLVAAIGIVWLLIITTTTPAGA